MQLWQLRQKIHQSWLIAILCVGIVIGVALVPHVGQTTFGSLVWLSTGIGLAGLVLWRRSVYISILIVFAGIAIGLWRGSVLQSQITVYETLTGQSVHIRGDVIDDPDNGRRGEILLRLGNIIVDNHAVAGKVWISTTSTKDIKRGDKVEADGVLSDGFGSFSGVMYRAQITGWQRPVPGDVARVTRDWFADKIRLGIDEPQASLGLGYLLGQKRALPEDLQQALVVTGLTHVVVASGYNLTILVRLARRLLEKVSKYLAALSATVMIGSFVAVTGASPSMSRAGLVSGLSLAAWYYGRKFHPLVILPLAAAITVLIDPAYAWNDLGWQLSFAAFAGVMIFAPLMQRYFFGDKEPGTIRQILGETVSAHIVTLPILIFAFGQFSNVAVFANVLVLPLVPLAMLLTFLAGIGSLFLPDFAAALGLPAQMVLTYMISIVNYFAGLPWAQTIFQIQPWVVWVSYVLIVSACLYMWRVTKYDLKDTNIIK